MEELEAQGVGGWYLMCATTAAATWMSSQRCWTICCLGDHTSAARIRPGIRATVQSGRRMWTSPMAVLVNGDTYSAAELFAAELQEMEWGIIVGTPTLWERVFPADLSAPLRRRDQHLHGQILYRKGAFRS